MRTTSSYDHEAAHAGGSRARASEAASPKVPFASDEQLRDLAERYPTPFYLYDESAIRERARALSAAFAWNPGFREHFAVKATPNPAIIGILAEEGCGVDCATGVELELARAMGMSGDAVMLTGNEVPDADYLLAYDLDATVNLDDLTQLSHFERACAGVGRRMGVRVNPGSAAMASALGPAATRIQGEPDASKFGMTPDQAKECLLAMQDLGVEELGLHSFLSSNSLDEGYYPALARYLFGMAADLARDEGLRISYVDLSGGVGIAYRPDEVEPDIARIGEGVRQAYEELLVPAGLGDVAVLTELGRYLMAPCGALVTRVIGTKSTYRDYLGVDACSADLMRPMLYGAYHHVSVVGRAGDPADHLYDIVGGLCENSDRLAERRALPVTSEGDLLFIHDVGAHGHAMGYQYNGKLRHAEVLLRSDGTSQLIRRAETPEDYFATLDCLEVGRLLTKRKHD